MKITTKAIIGYVMAAAIIGLAIAGLLLPQTRAELSGVTAEIAAIVKAAKGIDIANTVSLSKLFQPTTYKEYVDAGFFKFGLGYAIFAIIGAAGVVGAMVTPSVPKRDLAIRVFAGILFVATVLIAVELFRIQGSDFLKTKKANVDAINQALTAIGKSNITFKSGIGLGFFLLVPASVLSVVVAVKPSLFIEE